MKQSLIERALEVSRNAYAPYSKFRVGAAVLLGNGEIVVGCNFENASYGLSMCAERVALYNAHVCFPNEKIIGIAIASSSTNQLTPPCGACRQVIAEFAQKQNSDIEIIMTTNGNIVVKTIEELLPLQFKLEK